MRDTKENALDLARKGFRVFPLASGSKVPPRGLAWKEIATVIPGEIEKLWQDFPAANVGIATGNGVVVVDADCKDGKTGLASLETLRTLYDLPETFEVATPSGGRHVYLKCGESLRNSVDRLFDFPDIDIRADGGYVVGPGSALPEGAYAAIAGQPDALAEMPAAVLAVIHAAAATARSSKSETPLVDLDQPANIDRAKEYLIHRAPEAIEGAGGDDTTYRVATRCRDYGLSEGVALELMLEHWNESKASPPWIPDELSAKVANAYAYASGGWGGQTAEAEFGALDIDVGESPSAIRAREAKSSFAELLLNATAFAGKPMVERPWHVPGLIPAGTVTLLSGDGGTGKSLLALMLAVSTSTGRPWLGRTVRDGRCLYLSAEDDADEIHRRLADIQAASSGQIAELSRLDVLDLAGKNAVLGKLAAGRDAIQATALFESLLDWACEKRPALIVLDTLADIFGGDEIVRVQARQFIGLLKRLAIESGAAVVVLAHPSLSGMASGEGTSGSTAWSNSVRSRLYFERVKEKNGSEIDPDRRALRTKKSNYGRVGEAIEVRWRDGVFVPLKAGDADTQAAERHVEQTFLQLLRAYTAQGRRVSDANGTNYAPALFERDKGAGGIRKEAFGQAMNRLFEKRAVEVRTEGPPSKLRRSLVATHRPADEYSEDCSE